MYTHVHVCHDCFLIKKISQILLFYTIYFICDFTAICLLLNVAFWIICSFCRDLLFFSIYFYFFYFFLYDSYFYMVLFVCLNVNFSNDSLTLHFISIQISHNHTLYTLCCIHMCRFQYIICDYLSVRDWWEIVLRTHCCSQHKFSSFYPFSYMS